MASSRLKRKIEVADEGQYGNLTESFVSIGTALPALTDHIKDKNEFKPVWEQEVHDEQGRRRFHGAFTGGFSAGYYNSVGSKEGWKPSTFKSSRSQRASQQNQSVADAAKAFMDEEDLAEMASSRTIETSSSYASSSRAPPPAKEQEYDPLFGLFGGVPTAAASTSSAPQFDQTLASLIEPSSSRVGLKLMRKMGWREGQGVGPRVSYQQRKRQAAEIGVQLDQDEAEVDGDSEAAKHYYAPLDRPLVLVKGSSTSTDKGWGLGYQPGMGLKETLRKEGGYSGSMAAKTMTYELDDDDVYGGPATTLGDLSDRQKRGIRTLDADEDNGEFSSMRSSRAGQSRQPRPRVSVPQDEFSDGSRLLPGFVLHREPFSPASSSQLPPTPPPGWQPDPSRLWKENQPPTSDATGKGKQLDAEGRGSLLGEKASPPMPKSVFDYLSAKSRERLASLTVPNPENKPDEVESRTKAAVPPPPPSDVPLFVPPLDRPTANAALRGFQPYSAASTSPDPIKQARYTLYLQYQASENASTTSSPFGPRVLPNGKLQTIEELNRELHEYSQAARVFKPVSGMLGNRFQTSQSGSLDVPKAEPGLYQPPPKAAATSLADKYGDAAAGDTKPPEPTLTPAQQAARTGNFGPLTRTTTVFRPARLLCKRFGVRDPHEAQSDEGGAVGGKWGEATATGREFGAGTSQPIGQSAIDEMMQSSGFRRFQAASKEVEADAPEVAKGAFEAPAGSATGGSTAHGAAKHRPAPAIETVGYGDDETQGEDIVAEKRAPADIFAAIFADSDDDDDSDDSDDEPDTKPAPILMKEDVRAGVDSSVWDPYAPVQATAVATNTGPNTSDSTRMLSVDDLSSYKPSFVPAVDRTSNKPEKSSKAKKKSSSKRKAGGLSFDLDEGGEEAEEFPTSRKKSRKDDKGSSAKARDRDDRPSTRGTDEKSRPSQAPIVEDDEWEEAAPTLHPDVIKATRREADSSSRSGRPDTGGTARARPRAADLY